MNGRQDRRGGQSVCALQDTYTFSSMCHHALTAPLRVAYRRQYWAYGTLSKAAGLSSPISSSAHAIHGSRNRAIVQRLH